MTIYLFAYGELEISRYLTYRANREKKPMELTDEYFITMIQCNINCLFGIQLTESGGDVISDVKRPRMLLDFRAFEQELFDWP